MSGADVALAFFDSGRALHGSVRSDLTLLFDHGSVNAPPGEVDLSHDGEGYRAVVPGSLDLAFRALSPPLDLGGARARVCAVSGRVGEASVDCLGTATETHSPPRWEELDALRSLSAVWDADTALIAAVCRPRGALGHGQEQATAWLLHEAEPLPVEEARLSTVYGARGRQRSAGLELWLADQDLPRRASGVARAGTSVELEDLVVTVALFEWTMDGRVGYGLYELTTRRVPAAAA